MFLTSVSQLVATWNPHSQCSERTVSIAYGFGRLWLHHFFLAGGRCLPDPPDFGWEGKASLNGRPQHLIEAAKRGRLDQMLFFGADDATGAADNRPKTDNRKKKRKKLGEFFHSYVSSRTFQTW